MLSGTHGCKQVRYSIPETSPHKTLHQRMGKARRSQEVVCMSVCLYVCAFHECLTVFFVCMSSCLHTCVYHVCVLCFRRSEEIIRYPGNGVENDCKSPHGGWEPNLSLLQEQQVLLLLNHLSSP